jgi:hypothetical protein
LNPEQIHRDIPQCDISDDERMPTMLRLNQRIERVDVNYLFEGTNVEYSRLLNGIVDLSPL